MGKKNQFTTRRSKLAQCMSYQSTSASHQDFEHLPQPARLLFPRKASFCRTNRDGAAQKPFLLCASAPAELCQRVFFGCAGIFCIANLSLVKQIVVG
jgi:hypothetical protein